MRRPLAYRSLRAGIHRHQACRIWRAFVCSRVGASYSSCGAVSLHRWWVPPRRGSLCWARRGGCTCWMCFGAWWAAALWQQPMEKSSSMEAQGPASPSPSSPRPCCSTRRSLHLSWPMCVRAPPAPAHLQPARRVPCAGCFCLFAYALTRTISAACLLAAAAATAAATATTTTACALVLQESVDLVGLSQSSVTLPITLPELLSVLEMIAPAPAQFARCLPLVRLLVAHLVVAWKASDRGEVERAVQAVQVGTEEAMSKLCSRSARLLLLLLQAAVGLPPWFAPCSEAACLRLLPPRDAGGLMCMAWDCVLAHAAGGTNGLDRFATLVEALLLRNVDRVGNVLARFWALRQSSVKSKK